ncbi:MAG TPA: FecR family protein [Burkholderiales bacterium]|nr:FecR family protein [Burkholderiales bacterium]
MIRILPAGLLALVLPLVASAAAVVESINGSARVGETSLAQGQRFAAPAAISTGPGAQVKLKFDDGMQIVLGENSLLRVVDFRRTGNAASGRAVFDLLRGGARVVTGTIARDNPQQFFFRTPQTQLTVERPADFSVVLVNPAYIVVHAGSLISSNGWGIQSLGTQSTTMVAANAAAPTAIAPSVLPASAARSMQSLQIAQVGLPAGGGAASGAAATAGPDDRAAFAVPAVLLTLGLGIALLVNEAGKDTVSTTQH